MVIGAVVEKKRAVSSIGSFPPNPSASMTEKECEKQCKERKGNREGVKKLREGKAET